MKFARVHTSVAGIIVGTVMRRAQGLDLLLLVAAYVVAAKIGFRAALVAEQVSPVWPPTGLALWAALYFGRRALPAVWAGALIANLTTNVPLVAAAAIATGNTLEAFAGFWLLRRVGVGYTLEGLRHVAALIVAATLGATIVSATVGVAALCAAGLQPWSRFGMLWSIWWLGDTSGALLVAPVLLTWHSWRRSPASRWPELGGILVATLIGSAFLFGPLGDRPKPDLGTLHPLKFTIFPLVIWAGLRFAHPGAALISATVSSIAVWGTLHGLEPFGSSAGASAQDTIMLLQIFTIVVAVSGLVLGGAIAERDRAERLRAAAHTLTTILASDRDLKDAARPMLEAVCEALDWDVGNLWRASADRTVLELVESWQRSARLTEFVADSRARRFTAGVGLPGRVWESGEPASVFDVVQDRNFPRAAVAERIGLHGAFAFPIAGRSGVLGVMEFFARHPRTVDASVLALMASAGVQVGQFIERRSTQQRLVESEALNSAIVESALDCIISIDAAGRIIEFNPASTRTFGYTREQAIGQELAALLVPEPLREQHRSALARAVETGSGRILGQRVEMPALRADGTELTVELAITRVGSPERPVFTAHLRDVTDRSRIERERIELLIREQAARADAERANRTKDQFLATISHELRTPLTAILGWASILRTRQFDEDRLRQIHESMFRNAEVQARLVDDLLDVSRIATGQLRLTTDRVDVCDLVRVSVETVRPAASAKSLTLTTDIPAEPCYVFGDAARLQQVCWNLLSNAIKFTPSEGTIAVVVCPSVERVTIAVRDTGIGIDGAVMAHVFERFWQADGTSTRQHGGLGLGLSLVRYIVELHGGEVRAESEGAGRGSTFTVTLPVSGSHPEEASMS